MENTQVNKIGNDDIYIFLLGESILIWNYAFWNNFDSLDY